MLHIDEAHEDELYAAMDWLLERQDRIERKLAAKYLGEHQPLFDQALANLGEIPHAVWTNELLRSEKYGVRGHSGTSTITFDAVFDVSINSPNKGEVEWRLFHDYPIRWGTKHGKWTDCPTSPRFQPKMWSYTFPTSVRARGQK